MPFRLPYRIRQSSSLALHLHAGHTVVTRFRTHGAHLKLDAHRTGLFKHEYCVDMVACSERLLQTHKHDVERAGFELDRVTRLNFLALLDWSHLRYTVLHLHRVNLESGSAVRGTTDQPIGSGSSVFD